MYQEFVRLPYTRALRLRSVPGLSRVGWFTRVKTRIYLGTRQRRAPAVIVSGIWHPKESPVHQFTTSPIHQFTTSPACICISPGLSGSLHTIPNFISYEKMLTYSCDPWILMSIVKITNHWIKATLIRDQLFRLCPDGHLLWFPPDDQSTGRPFPALPG